MQQGQKLHRQAPLITCESGMTQTFAVVGHARKKMFCEFKKELHFYRLNYRLRLSSHANPNNHLPIEQS
jgi:hypothetical protein